MFFGGLSKDGEWITVVVPFLLVDCYVAAVGVGSIVDADFALVGDGDCACCFCGVWFLFWFGGVCGGG